MKNSIKKVQIFGNSKLVINWAVRKFCLQNIQLAQILQEVNRLADMFEYVDFVHIYRERNTLADSLAKDGSNVLTGTW